MTLDTLYLEIKNKRSVGKKSWQNIADDYGINKAMARLIGMGYRPGKKVSAALRLPASASVYVVGEGAVPDGAQTIRAIQCTCGRWFISNHPRRKRCFLCHPYSSRRRVI